MATRTTAGIGVAAVATVLLLRSMAVAAGTAPGRDRGHRPSLDDLLPRLARVSELFRDSTLRFSAKETITWSGKKLRSGRQKFAYLYTYSDEKGFDDYRTWLHGVSKQSPRDVDPGEHDVPRYLRSAFLWVFVFKDTRQHLHRYEIVGEESILDRPAVKIRFESLPPYQDKINDWFGWAWVDRETAQPLKVEAYRPEDWEEKGAFETHMASGRRDGHQRYDFRGELEAEWSYEVEKITTEFTVVKNGMRFPGTVEIQRTRYAVYFNKRRKYRATPLLQVRQVYTDYQFFGVRTAEEILGLVASQTEAGK